MADSLELSIDGVSIRIERDNKDNISISIDEMDEPVYVSLLAAKVLGNFLIAVGETEKE